MSSPFPSQNPNRASLLAGLRTGGVRNPQSAAPTSVAFDPAQLHMPQQPQQQQYVNRGFMTSAVDGPNNSFAAQQQGQQLNPYQFQQAMQLEMLKLQAQQYQTELLRQQQASQQQAALQQRRPSFNPPATAGPTGGFDLRSAAMQAQNRRSQVDGQLKASASADQVPMTARLDGKFATRSASVPFTPTSGTTVISGGTSLGSMASNNQKEVVAAASPPSKSDSATSWRRGSSSGNSALNGLRARATPPAPLDMGEKDRASPPPIGITAPTPPSTTGQFSAGGKRPKPLNFSLSAQKPMIPEVLIDNSEAEEEADDAASSSSGSSRSSHGNVSGKSSPTTSNELLSTNDVNIMQPPLSPREEATKKLYEGLGVGRPRSRGSDVGEAPPSPRTMSINVEPPQTAALFPSHSSQMDPSGFPQSPFFMAPVPHTASLSGPSYAQHRLDRNPNQPKRQPRGPPSNTEELGPLNFAARSPRLPHTAGLVSGMQGLAVEAY